MRLLLSIVLVAAATSSCNTEYETELATIDSLLVKLDSARSILYTIDTTTAFQRLESAEENIRLIQGMGIALSREDLFLLDEYNSNRKAYSRWNARLSIFYEEIETIPVQLRNLRRDLSRILIEREEAGKFMNSESTAVLAITTGITDMSKRFALLDKSFPPLQEKILNLIVKLEDEKKAEVGNGS